MGSNAKSAPEADLAKHAGPYKVAALPTEDGTKVLFILRASEEDQQIYWLDASAAKDLCEALFVIACSIEDQGVDSPPTKN